MRTLADISVTYLSHSARQVDPTEGDNNIHEYRKTSRDQGQLDVKI